MHGRRARRAASRASARPRSRRSAGPVAANTSFIAALSMPTADASTPAPTYGTLASSSRPCTVPSSPYGPCSTGKTTSRPRPETTASWRCRAIDRDQRVAARVRDEVRFARGVGLRALSRRCDDVGRRRSASAARSGSVQRPSFSIRIATALVALGIEVLKHRRRRRERHLVLAGAAAVDHADAQFSSQRFTQNRTRGMTQQPLCPPCPVSSYELSRL